MPTASTLGDYVANVSDPEQARAHGVELVLATLGPGTAHEDTIAVPALDVKRHIEMKNRSGYRRAAEQLGPVRQVAHHAGRDVRTRRFWPNVPARHERKRSLLDSMT